MALHNLNIFCKIKNFVLRIPICKSNSKNFKNFGKVFQEIKKRKSVLFLWCRMRKYFICRNIHILLADICFLFSNLQIKIKKIAKILEKFFTK